MKYDYITEGGKTISQETGGKPLTKSETQTWLSGDAMPTEREIEAGAKALALTKVHTSKLTDTHIQAHKFLARLVLVAARAERIRAKEERAL